MNSDPEELINAVSSPSITPSPSEVRVSESMSAA